MVDNKFSKLNKKVGNLLKLSETGPKALEPLLDRLLDSLNVETDAAIENAERVIELAVLNTLGDRLSSAATSTVEAILRIVYEQTTLLMDTRNFYVAFYDKNLDMVTFPFVREKGKVKKQVGDWAPRKKGQGLTENIIRMQVPLLISKDVDDWFLNHQDDVVRTGKHAKSWLGVPMITRDDLIGVIALQDYEKENTYNANDLRVLSIIANHAAIAVANARFFQSNLRQANQALQLRKVSQAITSTLELKEVLLRVVQGARSVMNADLVALYPMIQGKFDSPIMDGKTLVKHELIELPQPGGLASMVLDQGFLVYENLEDNPEMISKFVEKEEIRSFAGVALRVGGDVVDEEIVGGESMGVLYFNYRQPYTFSELERNTIYLFAAQAATAIQNASLFNQTKADLARRNKEFKAIERINIAITSQTQDTVLERILEAAIEIMEIPTGHILLVDDSEEYLEIKAYKSPTEIKNLRKKYKIGEEGVSGWVAKNKKTALIPDISNLDPELEDFYMAATSDTLSSLTVPLLDDYENYKLLGIINLESNRVNAFTGNDKALIEALARQASIAIRNQRRYEREKRASEEAKVLSDIDKQISSTLSVDVVLQFILDEGLKLLNAAKGNIMLYDKVKGDLFMAVGRGEEDRYKGARQAVGEGIVGMSAKEKKCYRVSDVTEPEWNDIYKPFIPGMRSELAVPLIQDEKLIGVINVESPQVGHFSESDKLLFKKLGDHAVIAILNAKQHEQLKALREIDKAIISASNADQILDLIIDNALRLTGAEIGEIRLVEPATKDLVLHSSRFPEEVEVDETFRRVPFGKGIIGWCIMNRKPVLLNDSKKDDRYIPYFQGMRSELAAPLKMKEDVLGAVSLESPQVDAFDESDLELLETLAGQAVIAIQKAQAYNRAENESDRFRMLHRAGQELGQIADYADLSKAYEIILRTVHEHTQSKQTVIRRFYEKDQELRNVASMHPDMEPPFKIAGINEGLNGKVFQDRQTVVVNNINNPPKGVNAKPSDPKINSLLITPIYFENHYYGNLGLSHEDIGHFTEPDIELIEGLANQLAITIHRLEATDAQQRAEQRVREAEVMGSIGQSAFELAHRLSNDLGLVRTYRNKILDELETLKVTSPYIEEQLEKIVLDVKQVLDLSSGLKSDFQLTALSDTREGDVKHRDKVPISVSELLNGTAKSYDQFDNNIEVRVEVAKDVGVIFIRPDQIQNALRNLFINAVQAMPDGGIITLRAMSIGEYVEIQIEDTGTGIDPAIIPRIFDLFYSTKRSSGFGLWSARAYVLASGGEIRVESLLGCGTTFTILLPKSANVQDIRPAE